VARTHIDGCREGRVANRGKNDGTMEVGKCGAVIMWTWGSVDPVNRSGGHGRPWAGWVLIMSTTCVDSEGGGAASCANDDGGNGPRQRQ